MPKSSKHIRHCPTQYWHPLPDGRVQCDVCPRACKLHENQRGLCYVRGRGKDGVLLYSYGSSSGFCIDPIEKKPLFHFLPGTPVLSFGTAGCNLACKFCQNWDVSKSREMDTLAARAMPEALAATAKQYQCRSVAFTYNDPVIFLEYAMDTAAACREVGVKTVAVTAGYICDKPREDFFNSIDAANIDLKSFNEKFYDKICGGHLKNVLETIEYVYHHTDVWMELTSLLIPGENDSDKEIHAMSAWLIEHLGPDVPLHFSAFHPDYKMLGLPRTPLKTLARARKIAMQQGLRYVYTGNVHDASGGSTWCAACGECLLERDWYQLGDYSINAVGGCSHCGEKVAGVFEKVPGRWGSRRLPVRIMR